MQPASSRKKKAVVVVKKVLGHHMTQKDAKTFIPPGSSVWQDRARGGWCGHVEPYRRASMTFDKFGGDSDAALKALLQALWFQYAELEAKPVVDVCIVADLFS